MKKHRIRGINIWLDPSDNGISHRLIATNGYRERAFDWVIRKEASGVAFDVGANIGWCSLQMAKTCKEVWSFEPDPRNLRLLRKNKGRNMIVNEHAIGQYDHMGKLVAERKPNLNTVQRDDHGDLEVRSIDSICAGERMDENVFHPNFVKMDIEGGELLALKGATETIAWFEPKFLIEVHPEKYKDDEFAEVLGDMVDMGYRFKYVINAKGKMHKLKKYKCVKRWKGFPRAVWTGVPDEQCIKWATTMPKDGKKVLRSIYLEKP